MSSLQLVPAGIEDSYRLLAWRNDPETIHNSVNRPRKP